MTDPIDIAVRAWTETASATEEPATPEPRPPRKPNISQRFPDHVLVFDTETTADAQQALLFGAWRYCRVQRDGPQVTLHCVAEGLFYADDLAETDPGAFAELNSYAAKHRASVAGGVPDAAPQLTLMPLGEWAERVLYRVAYRMRGAVVCFNAPFDISRIAWDVGYTRSSSKTEHDAFEGGFSFKVFRRSATGPPQDGQHRPRIAVKALDSKRSLKAFRAPARLDAIDRIPDGGDGKATRSFRFRGHFLDLRTLVFALTDRGHSLESGCAAYGVPFTKRDVIHGQVTNDYITYCREDVGATQDLCAAAISEFLRHPIALQATRAYSPATIGRGYLKAMGVTPPRTRQRIDPQVLGWAMSAYYGGRAEARIRRTPVPVVYCDFLSMYPTVCTLMGVWHLLTAETIEPRENTAEIAALLARVTADDVLDPELWPQLIGIAQIKPHGDVLPVRGRYGMGPSYQIGINHLTSDEPMWFTIADLIASKLLTGRAPTILKAISFEARGTLPDLQAVDLMGETPIDPLAGDFFRTVIEQRKRAAARGDEKLARGLKTLANATSYGIYAQMTPRELPAKQHEIVTVYGYRDEPHDRMVTAPEDPGAYAFPPVAAVITGGARLLLGLAEHLVTKAGGGYAFCDTDSVAIVATEHGGPVADAAVQALSWLQVDRLRRRFERLNPYDPGVVGGSLLELEKENHRTGGEQRHQLHCYAISAKRYVLFSHDTAGEPAIVKASEHGLGHLLNPSDPDSEDRGWIAQSWTWLLRQALGLPAPEPEWLDRPAVSQLALTSPAIHALLRTTNDGVPYAQQIKPFGFLLIATVAPHEVPADDSRIVLIAPYDRDPRVWTTAVWTNRHSGRVYRITGEASQGYERNGLVTAKSHRQILQEYATHPESKSSDQVGGRCSRRTAGVLRRREVTARTVSHVGKEANQLEAAQRGLIDARALTDAYDKQRRHFENATLPVLRALGVREVARRTGHSLGAVSAVLAQHSYPRPAARERYQRLVP